METKKARSLTPREIRRLRGSLGMTQAQFAMLLNTHSTTVSRWEAEPQVAAPDAWQLDVILTIGTGASKRPASADDAIAFLSKNQVGMALGVLLGMAQDAKDVDPDEFDHDEKHDITPV